MSTQGTGRALVLSTVFILLLSSAGPALAAPQPTIEQSSTLTASTSDEFINTSSNVSVWKRAGLPLRTDTSNGATTLDVPDTILNVTSLEGAEGSLNKRTLAVYNTGSTISLSFQSRQGADTSQFKNDNVQLLVGRLKGKNAAPTDISADSSDFTLSEALDLLSGANLTSEEVNANVTFTGVKSTTLDSNGEATFSVNPEAPGQYVFVLARTTSGNGFSVSDGNVSLDGSVQIVGTDAAPVQATAATATPGATQYTAGDNVTFTVDSGLAASNVNHTVILVDEGTLRDQQFAVTVEGELDQNLSAENVSVTHTIKSVNGVARLDAGASVMGVSLEDQRVSRQVALSTIIDFVANNTNRTLPNHAATGSVVLNASVTSATNASSSTQLTVETAKNWTGGTYTYVYVASTNNSTQFSTVDGTVDIAAKNKTEVELNVTANRTSLTVGQHIKLTVTRPDGTPVEGATVTIDGQTVTTGPDGTVTVKLSKSGKFTVSVTKADTLSKTFLTDTIDVSVAKRSTGSQQPAGGGGQQSDSEEASAEAVPVADGATVNVRDAQGGQTVSVSLTNVASEDAAVTGFNITTTFDETSFRVEFTKPQREPPTGTPALDSAKGTAINYFTADAIGITDDRITNAQFTFTVSQSALPEGTNPEDVVLFRYHDGEWQTLETTHLGGNRYRATTPGFSAFAIGIRAAQTPTPTDTPTTPTDTPTTPTDTPTPVSPTDDDQTATPGPTFLGGGNLWALFGVLVVLVFIVGGFYLYREGHLDDLLGR